jgi:hypothetical protein
MHLTARPAINHFIALVDNIKDFFTHINTNDFGWAFTGG